MKSYTKIAILAAKEAGRIHKKYFNKDLKVTTKGSSFELLTIADTESEKKIVKIIRDYFPNHNILAEENKYKNYNSKYTWIIDPLDGTSNFSFGLPIFCVSIAFVQDKEVVCGVIYDVTRDELFYAEKNRGAFLNGKKIRVNKSQKLSSSILITGFYYNRGKEMLETIDNIKKFLLKRIIGIRRLGAAALDLCYVACGRASGFWEFELNPWDFAAGKLILEEAGGMVTGRFNEKVKLEKSYIVSSNGRIHRAMLEVLR